MREIVMDGPGKNALGTPMMDFLLGELDAARGEPVLLTGKGDAFSAGLNLKEVASLDEPGMRAFLLKLEELMARLFDHPAPTVALVNGHAIAGGCVLLLCCDLRVAAEGSYKIGLNESPLGLRFPPRILRIVRARVPSHTVHEVLLGGGLFLPREALRLGLLDEVAADAPAVARARMASLAACPREAYAANKAELHRGVAGPEPRDATFLEEALPSWTSPALKERIVKVLAR